MPRKTINFEKVSESKTERFIRLGNARFQKVAKIIHQIGNLSTKANYEYTPDQVRVLFDNIEIQVSSAKKKFDDSAPKQQALIL